ncbi:MAG: hypothetical protein FRX49_05727 [Trebouxia sp. A1-2]|nr:MAG: hypothetical protein FRX49_05727 [Trebouxia sp. A1-2]
MTAAKEQGSQYRCIQKVTYPDREEPLGSDNTVARGEPLLAPAEGDPPFLAERGLGVRLCRVKDIQGPPPPLLRFRASASTLGVLSVRRSSASICMAWSCAHPPVKEDSKPLAFSLFDLLLCLPSADGAPFPEPALAKTLIGTAAAVEAVCSASLTSSASVMPTGLCGASWGVSIWPNASLSKELALPLVRGGSTGPGVEMRMGSSLCSGLSPACFSLASLASMRRRISAFTACKEGGR